jgi:hypothetical protein
VWRIQATRNPSAGGGALSGVACTSSSACTAVGGSNSGTLAERWNGTRWTIQPTPNPAMAFQITLDSVACPAPRFCTAVGDYGVNATGDRLTLGLQWRGTGQGPQHSAAPPQPGVSCAGLPAAPSRPLWDLSDAQAGSHEPQPGIESPD